jgi:hypothetical protein
MPLLQMMQPQQQSGMDPQQMMRLIGMMAAAGGGAPGAGTPPPPSMEGMMPPSGMMPTPQGASMMPAPMGPPTQLQSALNPPVNNLGLGAGPSSFANPNAVLTPNAYNRPAAPMPPPQLTDAGIAAQEAALQAQDDALQASAVAGKKPDYSKAATLLGQMNKQMSSKAPPPQMQPLSRGQAAPIQPAASPLANTGGGYREMLMKLAQGRYG